MAGAPISDAPATSQSGVRRCARYQCGGSAASRWGSLARIGAPDFVLEPADGPGVGAAAVPREAPERLACRRQAVDSRRRPSIPAATRRHGPRGTASGRGRAAPAGRPRCRILSRVSSTSQLPMSRNDSSLPIARTSSARQRLGLGAQQGELRRYAAILAQTGVDARARRPRPGARTSPSSTRSWRRDDSTKPMRRASRSMPSVVSPNSSESVPRSVRSRSSS